MPHQLMAKTASYSSAESSMKLLLLPTPALRHQVDVVGGMRIQQLVADL